MKHYRESRYIYLLAAFLIIYVISTKAIWDDWLTLIGFFIASIIQNEQRLPREGRNDK